MSVVKKHTRSINGKTVAVREHSRKGGTSAPSKSLEEYKTTEDLDMTIKKPKKRKGPVDMDSKRYRVKNKAKMKKAAAKYRKKNRKKLNAKASKRRKVFG